MKVSYLGPALALLLGLGGCHNGTRQSELDVFAAASLKEPFTVLKKRFESEHRLVTVNLNFAGSQQLAMQISKGAPARVFASADLKQMKSALGSRSLQAREFAENRLVVVANKKSKITSLNELSRPGYKIVIANREVPAGKYSLEMLGNVESVLGPKGFKGKAILNVVSYEQDVRAVLEKVRIGEADAGIVYQTDVNPNDGTVRAIPIGENVNVIAKYYIAPINPSDGTAQEFVALVLSSEGKTVLAKSNFLPSKGG